MTSWINQFSMLVIVLLIPGIVGLVLVRRGFQPRDWLFLGGLIVWVGLVWILLRPTSPGLKSSEQVRANIGSGQPVLLEFLSPY